jgi:hypothetical protein
MESEMRGERLVMFAMSVTVTLFAAVIVAFNAKLIG